MKTHFKKLIHDIIHSKHSVSWILLLVISAFSVVAMQYTSTNLKVSVMSLKTPESFDGTVYPLAQVPLWHELTTAERSASYSELPANKLAAMPRYNPTNLSASLGDLGYSDAENDIRDAIITYSVVYLGNYTLDGVEFAGSHPAVDIKAPQGTPVVSIANGIVTKVEEDSYGFGKHIVVKHINVPVLGGGTQTLYSSYSHLHEMLVSEGDLVDKGQLIGTVGDTGTATTKHLHFQIDKESAPWNPYWPFTYNDYNSRGMSFFDAINTGLGQENAIKHTINPMTFVQSHLSSDTRIIVDASDIEDARDSVEPEVEETPVEPDPTPDPEPEVVEQPEPEVEETPDPVEITSVPTKRNYTVDIKHDSLYVIGNTIDLEIRLKNDQGQVVDSPYFAEAIIPESSDEDIASTKTLNVTKDAFRDGVAIVKYDANEEGEFRAVIPFGDNVYKSELIVIKDEVKEVYGFEIVHDGSFEVGEKEEIRVYPIDEDGYRTAFTVPGDVKVSLEEGSATFTNKTLQSFDFVEGYAVVDITPQNDEDIIVKAQHAFMKGTSERLKHDKALFSDLTPSHVNYEAIKTLKARGVISGYPDGSFKPEKGVSRVEALKLIFAGLDANVPSADSVSLPFPDTANNQWYSPFLAYAMNLNIVKGYPDGSFKPTQTVNKAEMSKMIVLALGADVSDVEVSSNVADDVFTSDWFAPYVKYLLDEGIIDLAGGKYHPAEAMDRAKVAEAIYRATN